MKEHILIRIFRIVLAAFILLLLGSLALFLLKLASETGLSLMTVLLIGCALFMGAMGYITCIVLLGSKAHYRTIETAPVDSDEFFNAAIVHIKAGSRSQMTASVFLAILFLVFGVLFAVGANMGPTKPYISPIALISGFAIAVRCYRHMRKIREGMRIVQTLPASERIIALGQLAKFLPADAQTRIISERCARRHA